MFRYIAILALILFVVVTSRAEALGGSSFSPPPPPTGRPAAPLPPDYETRVCNISVPLPGGGRADARVTEPLVVEDPAGEAAERLAEACGKGGHVVLTGGSTPRKAYEQATAMLDDWSAVELWFTDERCVPPDHEHSNYGMAKAALLDRIQGNPPTGVHRMQGELGPDEGADLVPAIEQQGDDSAPEPPVGTSDEHDHRHIFPDRRRAAGPRADRARPERDRTHRAVRPVTPSRTTTRPEPSARVSRRSMALVMPER